jgi:hypothetical protein
MNGKENIKVELSEQIQRLNSELDAMGILLDTKEELFYVGPSRLWIRTRRVWLSVVHDLPIGWQELRAPVLFWSIASSF